MNIPNTPTLQDIAHTPAEDLVAMPLAMLNDLIDQAKKQKAAGENAIAFLSGIVAEKFKGDIDSLYSEKDSGTVRIKTYEGLDVVVNRPKRIDWDQKMLAEIEQNIFDQWQHDPADYIDVTRKVAEKKFNAWPAQLQQTFLPARTTKIGAQSIKIEESK